MPLCTLHLVRLRTGASPGAFLGAVSASRPLVWAGKVFEAVVYDGDLDRGKLVGEKWDVGVLIEGGSELPPAAASLAEATYTVSAGVPTRVLDAYPSLNAKLFGPPPARKVTKDPVMSPDSSKLSVSKPMLEYADRVEGTGYRGPVSQINLLCFRKTEGAKESYGRYGQGFQKVGGSHGGSAKIVGNVVEPPKDSPDSRGKAQPQGKWWDEIAIAQYPTVRHFVDMASDPAYREINTAHRLPALDSTVIVSTRDIRPDEEKGVKWARL
ncbi:hypothetical protein DFJ74DRAFT_702498 [Hyaloraphidium curvatum]|nr:hypothetical protein DFJ74DRAFT_702498 [Hyaloraphidium curvatum]